jgi:hypothetical protein
VREMEGKLTWIPLALLLLPAGVGEEGLDPSSRSRDPDGEGRRGREGDEDVSQNKQTFLFNLVLTVTFS